MDDGLSGLTDLADLSQLKCRLAPGQVVSLQESSTGQIPGWMPSILVLLSNHVTSAREGRFNRKGF